MSRITLRSSAIHPERIARIAGGSAYSAHQALWRLFGDHPDRRRDFLYRREDGDGVAFTAVSAREPLDSDGIWHVETKPYQPRLREGMQLAFALRANPVRRRRDRDGRSRRHDVVMEEKHRVNANAHADPEPRQVLVERAGYAWLGERAHALGFEIAPETTRVEGYAQHQFRKGRARTVTFSSLDYRGLLRVTDPDALFETLMNGVGPSKAFGCGLLLVRAA